MSDVTTAGKISRQIYCEAILDIKTTQKRQKWQVLTTLASFSVIILAEKIHTMNSKSTDNKLRTNWGILSDNSTRATSHTDTGTGKVKCLPTVDICHKETKDKDSIRSRSTCLWQLRAWVITFLYQCCSQYLGYWYAKIFRSKQREVWWWLLSHGCTMPVDLLCQVCDSTEDFFNEYLGLCYGSINSFNFSWTSCAQ